jgi:hypothetical protein
MPSKIFFSSLLGRKKSAANIVHFSRARDTKAKENSLQYLKTNKENHVSRFIRGIHRHLKDYLNRAALIVLDALWRTVFCLLIN